MEIRDIESAIEGILFASGDPVSIERIALVLGVEHSAVSDISGRMGDRYSYERRGMRIVRVGDCLQMCSSPEYADIIRLALETGRQPRLSAPSLETLAVVAYFQPVTKAYIEQVRGVDSSYTISALLGRGFIEPVGRLDAPGRPITYGTTAIFLRTFGIASLDELPELPGVEESGEQMSIMGAIGAIGAEREAKERP
ncbi:MAG: SMC-Scp complex subunit ScpB [Oscillospiraceae bacterium]|jgi:segregation and condensation protein B|nr:SMC-Scp complex subunit ScpB [Oscillospiraceae bacterium]